MHRRQWLGYMLGIGLSGASVVALAAPPPEQVAQEKAQTFAQASGTQAGTIDTVSGGTLNLTPYNTASDVKAFDFQSNVPVFQGNGKITTAALLKGLPVRLHYKNAAAAGQKPQVVAVEALSNQEANAAKQQAESAPPLMMAQVGPAAAAPSSPGGVWAPPAKPGTATTEQKQNVIASASGSQPGKITKVEGGKLFLDPYQQAAGEAELRLDQSSVVYQGNGQVSADTLKPGTDVRVYYKNEPGQRPKVVAVDLLDKNQATQLENAERNAPKKK